MIEPIFYLIACFLATIYPVGIEPLFIIENQYVDLGLFTIDVVALGLPLCLLIHTGLLIAIYKFAGKKISATFNLRHFSNILCLVMFAILIFIFHFPFCIQNLFSIKNRFLVFILSFIPIFMFMMISTCIHHVNSRGSYVGSPGLGAVIKFQSRCAIAFVFIPVVVILGVSEIFSHIPQVVQSYYIYPFLSWFSILLLLIIIFTFSSPYLKTMFSAKRITNSEIKEKLLDLLQKVNMQDCRIYSITTSGAFVANAFFTGAIKNLRSVFFTEDLLKLFTPDELQAVLSHEIGHARRRHTLYYFMLLVSFVFLSLFITHILLKQTNSEALAAIAYIVMFMGFWFFVFSFCSRRFEMEADYYGANLLNSTTRFTGALYKIAILNGIHLADRSIRHYSIVERGVFLELLNSLPAFRAIFEKSIRTIKKIITIAFIGGICVAGYFIYLQILEKPQRQMEFELIKKAMKAEEKFLGGDGLQEAEQLIDEVVKEERLRLAEIYVLQARIKEKLGKKTDAIESARIANKHLPRHPSDRLFIKELLWKE